MLIDYKKKANKLLAIGFLVWFVGNVMKDTTADQNLQYYLGYAVFLIGYTTFILGCVHYAKAKGYKWFIGLLGILNLIGLIVLAILPDKNK